MKSLAELRNLKLRLALEAVKKDIVGIAGADVRLIVYGSYARGDEREDSDVDLMVVLPDEKKTFEIEDRIRDRIYDAGFKQDMLFSVMVVSEAQAVKYAGFMVFGGVEKEGIAV